METTYIPNGKVLIVHIKDDIDHHSVEKMRRKMDNEITRHMPRKIVFDFSRVTFMDSAGIGFIIGRYKMLKMIGGNLEIQNVNLSTKKILEMSGIVKLVPVKDMLKAN